MPITPGPWKRKEHPSAPAYNYVVIHAESGRGLAICHFNNGLDDATANAQAIAALPDMVDALKAAEKVFYEMDVVDIPAWRMVRDALAKAEGRES